MYTANTPAPTVVVYQVHILRYRICISSGTAVYNQYERRRASDGGRAMYVHRNTAIPGAAWLLLLLSALYVCRFLSLPISVGIAGAPPWVVSAPGLAVGTWVWVQTRGNRRSPAARTRARRGTSESVWVSRCFCMCTQQMHQQRYSST